MAPKQITMDRLAVMVANGFQDLQKEMRERFGAVDGRFASMDGRLVSVESELKDLRLQVGRIERKLDSVVDRMDDHDLRLKRLEESAPQ